MKFKDALKKLEESKEFREWHKENKACYLTHGFIMVDPTIKQEWQIGYYHPDNEIISSFNVNGSVTKNPDAEAFKKEGKIEKLVVDKIKISLQEAEKKADAVQDEKYRAHTPTKKIFIIQKLDVGQVWNITYVTKTFSTLNIKVDSDTGKVVSDDLVSLFKVEK